MLAELERNPFQYPMKGADLEGARAAELFYRGTAWRLLYDVDDYAREVVIFWVSEHDEAYEEAGRHRYH